MDVDKESEAMVREASDELLQRSRRLFKWASNVTFVATLVALLLGIWVDWRWFPTAVVVGFVWAVANQGSGTIRTEQRRRQEEVADDDPSTL